MYDRVQQTGGIAEPSAVRGISHNSPSQSRLDCTISPDIIPPEDFMFRYGIIPYPPATYVLNIKMQSRRD